MNNNLKGGQTWRRGLGAGEKMDMETAVVNEEKCGKPAS